jgi:hypothetical protein
MKNKKWEIIVPQIMTIDTSKSPLLKGPDGNKKQLSSDENAESTSNTVKSDISSKAAPKSSERNGTL